MKIIISGGHLTPALAFIDFIKKNYPRDEIIFVGRIFSQTKLQQFAQEKKEVSQKGIRFIPLKAIRISKTRSFIQKLTTLAIFFKSVLASWLIFIKEKPTILISFGGYLAIPLTIAAKLTKTPIITHEQTHCAGIANQLIARFAQKVAISHPSSAKYFPLNKTVLTGNLIRPELLKKTTKKPKWINQALLKPILLITGGNQGSWIINQTIKESLIELTKDWTVIHLCGQASSKRDYKKELSLAIKKLPITQQKNYYVVEWANAEDIAWVYNHAQVAISRAGANTTMELTIKKIPTIFIPLPFSHHDEQNKNAQFLVNQRAAELIPQKQLSSNTLIKKLKQIKDRRLKIISNLNQIKIPTNAPKLLYQLTMEVSS